MTEIGSELERVSRAKKGFIRSYGLFWDATEIDWYPDEDGSDPKQMFGRRNKNSPTLQVSDFWDQVGIYVLYTEYGPYYVGKTVRQSLGARLRQHRSKESKHAGRWDGFSWFGFKAVLKSKSPQGTRLLGSTPRMLLTDTNETVGDIETLLILALGTRERGNARDESFAVALRWEQIRRDEREIYLRRA